MARTIELVARRYAKALWLTAQNASEAGTWREPLGAFVGFMRSSPDLHQLVTSPVFSREEKWGVVSGILKQLKAPEGLSKFFHALLEAGRLDAVVIIARHFEALVDEALGEIVAEVESALPLTENQQKLITEKLEGVTHRKVKVMTVIRPELLAGIRVNVLGKTLDASLIANLNSMQNVLLQAEA